MNSLCVVQTPGGVGGCGCGSVEEGELCELTCGTAAVEEEEETVRYSTGQREYTLLEHTLS